MAMFNCSIIQSTVHG